MPKLSGVVRIPILRRLKAERRIYASWNTRLVRRVALKLLQASDGSKHLLYSKAYQGESRILMKTYGLLSITLSRRGFRTLRMMPV